MKPTTRDIVEGTAAVQSQIGKPGSGISHAKPAPPKKAPKPESTRQKASRTKVPTAVDDAADALGLPRGRNRRTRNSKEISRHVKALGIPTPPSVVFEVLAAAALLGLKQKTGSSVSVGKMWSDLVKYAEEHNCGLAGTYRAEIDSYQRRLRDMVCGWCLSWRMHHPRAAAVTLVTLGEKPIWTTVTNDGLTITGDEADQLPEPVLLSPGNFWNDPRLPDDAGDVVVNVEFLGLIRDSGIEKVMESMLDPEIRRWILGLGEKRPKTRPKH